MPLIINQVEYIHPLRDINIYTNWGFSPEDLLKGFISPSGNVYIAPYHHRPLDPNDLNSGWMQSMSALVEGVDYEIVNVNIDPSESQLTKKLQSRWITLYNKFGNAPFTTHMGYIELLKFENISKSAVDSTITKLSGYAPDTRKDFGWKENLKYEEKCQRYREFLHYVTDNSTLSTAMQNQLTAICNAMNKKIVGAGGEIQIGVYCITEDDACRFEQFKN